MLTGLVVRWRGVSGGGERERERGVFCIAETRWLLFVNCSYDLGYSYGCV